MVVVVSGRVAGKETTVWEDGRLREAKPLGKMVDGGEKRMTGVSLGNALGAEEQVGST